MKVFSVIGVSRSGKTATIEEIIKELRRRRYTVGSVKDIHFEGFALDTPGSNTDRHRKAGSQLVTARGLYETDILFPRRLPVGEILRFYSHDFVILEGVEDYPVPKIVCALTEQEIEERLDPTVFAISGVISQHRSEYRNLPVFNALANIEAFVDYIENKVCDVLPNIPAECCGECGSSCERLLADILKGKRKREDCPVGRERTELYIGGQEIPLAPFVRDILENTIRGLVSTLKGYERGQDIVVRISS